MTYLKSAGWLLLALFIIQVAPQLIWADGAIVPVNPFDPPSRLGEFYSIKYHRVDIEIKDQVAVTTVEQAFINETNRRVEVEYIFPLPRGSQVNQFSLIVDGQEIEGRLLDKDEAKRIYEDIVRRQKDPALLEYVDHGMFRTKVFPLPAQGERVVKLTYTELLPVDRNQVEYRYPLNTEKFSHKVLEEVRIDVKLEAQSDLKTVYSPSHDIRLTWAGQRSVEGHYSEEGTRPETDFRLFWTYSKQDIGAALFTYRPDKNEDGYFLFLASPKVEIDKDKVIAKNIVLVLDNSGSMEGYKVDQAKAAARFIVERISPEDKFNVVVYNSTIDPIWPGLRPCSEDARREALGFIDRVQAGGSTDIHGALTTALANFKNDHRPNYIIFMTDGLPTAGITDPSQIAAEVQKRNQYATRLFAFGVGWDVNAILLDKLGSENHGMADYVPPGEDIEASISSFYTKIQNPALTEPVVDFPGIRVRDQYPHTLPDIFHGGQMILAGRYRDAGDSKATLTGKAAGKTQTYQYDLDFAKETDREEYAFVARIWAQKKIGWLIEQVRTLGENEELVNEIVDLSKRYGIMTQYTSFLAEEDVDIAQEETVRRRAYSDVEALSVIETGAAGVSQSMQSNKMKGAGQAAPQAMYYDASGAEVTVQTVKIIGSKTFFLKKEGWIDAELKDVMKPKEISQFSDDYFELARTSPDQAKYLTFTADQAIVTVIDGVAYRIVPAE